MMTQWNKLKPSQVGCLTLRPSIDSTKVWVLLEVVLSTLQILDIDPNSLIAVNP